MIRLSGSLGYQIASLQARNTADFAVTGSSAKAAAGRKVTMTFTLADHGPGTLYDRSGGDGIPSLKVVPPKGTTIVGSSAHCQPYQSGNPGMKAHGPYNCWGGSPLIWSGTTYRFSLTLRVDTVVRGATGTVKLSWGPVSNSRPPFDHNAKNDSALLRLN